MAATRSPRKTAPLRSTRPATTARRKIAVRARAGAVLPMPTALYEADTHPDLVAVPRRTVVSVEGRGAPATPKFQACVGALYSVAFGLKYLRKRTGAGDFKVGPLEALWWVDDEKKPFMATPRGLWHWRLRMAVPDGTSEQEVRDVVAAALDRAHGEGAGVAFLKGVHVEDVPAAEMGRVLHVGPYTGEVVSFEAIRLMLAAQGRRGRNRHVEVYLGDPRRTDPARLKTVLLVETRKRAR